MVPELRRGNRRAGRRHSLTYFLCLPYRLCLHRPHKLEMQLGIYRDCSRHSWMNCPCHPYHPCRCVHKSHCIGCPLPPESSPLQSMDRLEPFPTLPLYFVWRRSCSSPCRTGGRGTKLEENACCEDREPKRSCCCWWLPVRARPMAQRAQNVGLRRVHWSSCLLLFLLESQPNQLLASS